MKFVIFAVQLKGSFDSGLKFGREKLEEKRGLISLEIIKDEAENNYKSIDAFLKQVGV